MSRRFVTVAAVTVLLDQLAKVWALHALDDGQRRAVLGDLLGLQLLFNPGAAFGTGAGYTIVLTLIALGAVIVLVRTASKLRDGIWEWGFGLFLGGALGNLIDRLFRDPGFGRGHVVDFIDYNGWFVGNVADLALTLAAVLLVLRAWQGVALDGTREEPQTKPTEDNETHE